MIRVIRYKDGSRRLEPAQASEHVRALEISRQPHVAYVIYDCGGRYCSMSPLRDGPCSVLRAGQEVPLP